LSRGQRWQIIPVKKGCPVSGGGISAFDTQPAFHSERAAAHTYQPPGGPIPGLFLLRCGSRQWCPHVRQLRLRNCLAMGRWSAGRSLSSAMLGGSGAVADQGRACRALQHWPGPSSCSAAIGNTNGASPSLVPRYHRRAATGCPRPAVTPGHRARNGPPADNMPHLRIMPWETHLGFAQRPASAAVANTQLYKRLSVASVRTSSTHRIRRQTLW